MLAFIPIIQFKKLFEIDIQIIDMKKNLTQSSKKAFIALVFLLSLATFSFGQTPDFYNFNAGSAATPFPLNSTSNNKVQWIYPPGIFNSMGTLGGTPAFLGLVSKVYFRASASTIGNFTDFSISLAQNRGTQTSWTSGTFNLGMTNVVPAGPQTITTSAGNWFEITLQNPFLYDPTRSLVVEMRQNSFTNGVTIRENPGIGNARITGGYVNTTGTLSGGLADFGFDLVAPTPCNTIATIAGTLTPNNPTVCSGQTISLTAPNATLASGLTYQWQSSPNGTFWTNIGGATNINYQPAPMTVTTHFRLIITCTSNSVSDTSAPSMVTVSPPTYASLPYSQDFEQWASYCSNTDVPNDYHWSNSPLTGNNSWRREDQGPNAIWSAPASGLYFPSSSQGNHSARFHSFATTGTGDLFLYVDCSSSIGNKTLSFDYINDNTASGTDNLEVAYSTTGPGGFFIPTTLNGSSTTWQAIFASIGSNSANTVIRFRASGGSNSVPGSDIGIDNIKVLSPCTGTPVAGVIDSTTACPNKTLTLNLSGGSLQGNINYVWETAPAATGPWTFSGTSAGPTYSTTITTGTYWRCIATCQSSSLADTTPVRFIDVLPFYICYCDNSANTVQFENIGNVNIRDKHGSAPILNNGNPNPTLNNNTAVNPYTLFQSITPPILYRDSSYYIDVTGISYINSFSNCWAKVYIDFNRDGVYNVTSELALSGAVRSTTNYMALDSFTVPAITNYGLTGMRVILQEGGTGNTVAPCSAFGRGEVEDYVIDLQLLPCSSPPNPGTSFIDDSTTCINNTVRIVNNTHDRFFANLNFSWQESSDGVVFNDIPNGDVDTMFRVVNQDMWYRYRTTCNGSSNSYSNVVRVRILPADQCIGVSTSTGPNDRSDIGGVVISEPPPTNVNLYTFTSGGPHLNNPASYKFYTNYTAAGPLDLFAANTYKFSIFHIMNTAIHNDAQVSIFIDYNGNQVFDLPAERVYNGNTSATNFFMNALVYIPGTVVTNTPVIMRVVLNEDLSPNPANDTGLGNYVSGETEDFYLRFNLPLNTSEVYDNIANVGIYPNPTTGVVHVDFDATERTEVNIDVLNLTGSVLRSKNLGSVSGVQNISMDLNDLAAGVYMMSFTAGDTKFIKKITITK